MGIFGIISLLAGIIQLIILIVLIVKFLNLTQNVQEIKEKMSVTETDFKTEFYKWYACGNLDKAKEILTNEIGKSNEFRQLINGGNPTYMAEMKEQLKKKYQTELKLAGIELNLDCINQ